MPGRRTVDGPTRAADGSDELYVEQTLKHRPADMSWMRDAVHWTSRITTVALEMAVRDLYACAPDTVPVVCCQNGVANERIALRRFHNVYGMVVFLPAEHLEPGVAVNFAEESAGMLDAGRYPIGVDDAVTEITAAIDGSGFSARADPHIMRQKYAKLLANLNNAVQAACGNVAQIQGR